MADQSYSVQISSLLAFGQELQTQVEGIAAPMNTLATQSGSQPQFGAFTEAWMLGDSQQSAIEEMYGLLAQVRQAISFAENVTSTVASGYQQADQDVAASFGYGAPDVTAAPASGAQYSSPLPASYPGWYSGAPASDPAQNPGAGGWSYQYPQGG